MMWHSPQTLLNSWMENDDMTAKCVGAEEACNRQGLRTPKIKVFLRCMGELLHLCGVIASYPIRIGGVMIEEQQANETEILGHQTLNSHTV